MKKYILILSTVIIGFSLQAQDFIGQWNGLLKVPNQELTFIFKIKKEGDKYITTMDSPDQGAKDLPTSSTEIEGQRITIKAASLGMIYKGELDKERTAIKGTFQQGGFSTELNLSRKAVKKKIVARFQEPKDFPYEQEEVTFKNEEAGIDLAGTLTYPKGKKIKKVVVLISGSGAQNRDSDLVGMNHRPFLVLSDYLTREEGIAVLRYDERGVGESTGEYAGSTSLDFSKDVEAAVDYLAARPEFEKAKIGLIGHSEGGMIAPMVANRSKAVDFVVLLAGPGIPIDELMILQARRTAEAQGVPSMMLDANGGLVKDAYTFMKANPTMDDETFKKEIKEVFKTAVKKHFPAQVQPMLGNLDAFAAKESAAMTSPWFRYFINYDPTENLEKLSVPALVLNGSLDVQVTSKENLAGMEKALSGNKKAKIMELENLNHLFQKAKTGSVQEYKKIEETFNLEALELIGKWICKVK